MRVDGPLVSCLLTAGISSKLLCSYMCDLPHTMHSAILKFYVHQGRRNGGGGGGGGGA